MGVELGGAVSEADYYKKLCELQRKTLEDCWQFIHATNRPVDLDSASAREWTLSCRVVFYEKDNKALRELCEEYREALHAKTNQP